MRSKMRPGKRSGAALAEDRLFRFLAALMGATLTCSAALSADLARAHMSLIGTVCGADPHPHCGWCLGAASLALAGLAAFYLAVAPAGTLTPIKARARRRSSDDGRNSGRFSWTPPTPP